MEQQLSYFAGRDGFIWWIGVVEDRGDPQALGRVRVRVFGYHTEDKTKLPTGDLPWAFCIQPANSASSGGIGTSPTGPIEGTWVIGFWRDPDFMQEPMVLGTIPGKLNASSVPQGGSPFDYSDAQTRPAGQIQTTTIIADGNTTDFDTSRYASNTASKVNSLVPWVRDRFGEGIVNLLNQNPDYDFSIGYGYRSLNEQRKLYNDYKSGRTTN